jgi:hypothetical protein
MANFRPEPATGRERHGNDAAKVRRDGAGLSTQSNGGIAERCSQFDPVREVLLSVTSRIPQRERKAGEQHRTELSKAMTPTQSPILP